MVVLAGVVMVIVELRPAHLSFAEHAHTYTNHQDPVVNEAIRERLVEALKVRDGCIWWDGMVGGE